MCICRTAILSMAVIMPDCSQLPCRLVLAMLRRHPSRREPTYYASGVPAALSAMPALRDLELLGVECASSAPEQELAAAPWPALSRLTSLSMSAKGNLESSTEARYLWLRWALPAAPQLRKLSVGGVDDPFEGVSTPPAPEQYRCIKVSPVPGASLLEHSATAPRRCQISCHSW